MEKNNSDLSLKFLVAGILIFLRVFFYFGSIFLGGTFLGIQGDSLLIVNFLYWILVFWLINSGIKDLKKN